VTSEVGFPFDKLPISTGETLSPMQMNELIDWSPCTLTKMTTPQYLYSNPPFSTHTGSNSVTMSEINVRLIYASNKQQKCHLAITFQTKVTNYFDIISFNWSSTVVGKLDQSQVDL